MIVILGGGIAGLSAAETLRGRTELPIKVLERDAVLGGASRTVRFGDFRYDLGGHRFYTKKANVQALVERLIGPDLLTVDRVSHICFRGKMVDYPLTALNALSALGWGRAFAAGCGYLANRVKEAFRPSPGLTFEQWAVSRFGRPLYRAYFKGYTEKLWGVPCDCLSADFAEQRIKGLSLREVIRDALFKRGKATTLVRHFLYPRLGFGMIPEAMAAGWQLPNELLVNSPAEKVIHDGKRIVAVESRGTSFPVTHCVSSLPMDDLVRLLEPRPEPAVLAAAEKLRYRDLVTLFVTFRRERVTRDHWIYFPDADCPFARFHEPRNWSSDMAPPGQTGLVIEFFCQRGDATWNAPADALYGQALDYLERARLARRAEAGPCDLQRVPKAYPVYELGYHAHVAAILGCLGSFENLHSVGRNALFRYTSADHYIDMGMSAAENILACGRGLRAPRIDIARIGTESGYAEDGAFHAPTHPPAA